MTKILLRVPLQVNKTMHFHCVLSHCSRLKRHHPHSVVDSFKAKGINYFCKVKTPVYIMVDGKRNTIRVHSGGGGGGGFNCWRMAGGCLPRRVSALGVSTQEGVCPGGCLTEGCVSRGFICCGGRGQGVSTQEGVCFGGVYPGGCLPEGYLPRRVSARHPHRQNDRHPWTE